MGSEMCIRDSFPYFPNKASTSSSLEYTDFYSNISEHNSPKSRNNRNILDSMTSPIVPTNTKGLCQEKGSPSNIQDTKHECIERVGNPSSPEYEIASASSSTTSKKAASVRIPTGIYVGKPFALPDMDKLTISNCDPNGDGGEGEEKGTIRFGFDTKCSDGSDGPMKSEQAFPRSSQSEQAFERRQSRRSDNSMINKVFRPRSRTITPCPGRRSKFSTLLMQSEKGRPGFRRHKTVCLLYTSPSPRDLSTSRMPSSA